MRFILSASLLICALAISSCARRSQMSGDSSTEESSPLESASSKNKEEFRDPNAQYVFKTPKGGTERLRVKDMTFETMIKDSIPVDSSEKKFYLCRKYLDKEEERIERAELDLELHNLITYLKKAPKPRELTEAQMAFIIQVPKCKPFVVEFNIVSRLLANYELLSAPY